MKIVNKMILVILGMVFETCVYIELIIQMTAKQ